MSYNKYKNKKTIIDGHVFSSKKEAQRYQYLKSCVADKSIRDLKLQPIFMLQEGFDHAGKKIKPLTYVADFYYYNTITGQFVIEDCKGWRTEVYKIKRKLFLKLLKPDEVFLET